MVWKFEQTEIYSEQRALTVQHCSRLYRLWMGPTQALVGAMCMSVWDSGYKRICKWIFIFFKMLCCVAGLPNCTCAEDTCVDVCQILKIHVCVLVHAMLDVISIVLLVSGLLADMESESVLWWAFVCVAFLPWQKLLRWLQVCQRLCNCK